MVGLGSSLIEKRERFRNRTVKINCPDNYFTNPDTDMCMACPVNTDTRGFTTCTIIYIHVSRCVRTLLLFSPWFTFSFLQDVLTCTYMYVWFSKNNSHFWFIEYINLLSYVIKMQKVPMQRAARPVTLASQPMGKQAHLVHFVVISTLLNRGGIATLPRV